MRLMYQDENIYSYIDKFPEDSTIAVEGESYFAWEAYQKALLNKDIDSPLIPYLNKIFDKPNRWLIPIFSCSGHKNSSYIGHILFRSTIPVEYTILNIFKPIRKHHVVSLKVHIWPNGAIGYMLYFSTHSIDSVLPALIKQLDNVWYGYE